MPAVTIEQNLESRQTYLRLRGVGHLLNKPQYSIGGDSNEMLGPEGWKNHLIVNEARQCLDGRDLLLEIDSRLINYIEPGRAIEIQVGELKFAERIQPPPLMSFPSSKAPLPSGVMVYDFVKSSFGGGAPDPILEKWENFEKSRPPPRPRDDEETRSPHDIQNDQLRQPFTPDMDGLTRSILDGEPLDSGHQADHTTRVDPEDDEPSEEFGDRGHTREVPPDQIDVTEDEHDADPGPAGDLKEDHEPAEDEPETTPQHNWKSIAAAILVGLVIGFFCKYITDEYGPWPEQSTPGATNRTIALLQTDAFGPLSEDLKKLPEKSPLGLAPDDLPDMKPLTINRGKSFFNYGATKALENKRDEAVYWYKRSVRMIEPDALTFLGDGYLNGDGVPRDARTGYQLLRLAAALGSEKARSYLVDRLGAGSIPNAPPSMSQAFPPSR
jgi:Sel1 repeat